MLAYSAMTKGESLIDTAQSFEAMGTDLFIIRHADNHTPDFIANELTTDAHIINAGDGTNRHPTQALLDLMTIQQCKGDFSNLSVAIVGDINHSRVAKSLVVALSKMSVPDIRLVGPDTLVSDTLAQHNVSVYHNLTDGIKNADVVIALRIQKERFDEKEHLDLKCYQKEFCITQEIMSTARPDAIVMHPGPINRNLEIASDVADSSQSMILKQVTNGVAMRMALLDTLIGAK
ncbi:MAG: aspartate carbamoyltransferase catalytic subunit [Coxiella sp. (in: Bacteria)]|nr:MAG: aspartate carbamoyltransferase catalytic subunit [Coxiella sp. (in: g-proteobacteria)]